MQHDIISAATSHALNSEKVVEGPCQEQILGFDAAVFEGSEFSPFDKKPSSEDA